MSSMRKPAELRSTLRSYRLFCCCFMNIKSVKGRKNCEGCKILCISHGSVQGEGTEINTQECQDRQRKLL